MFLGIDEKEVGQIGGASASRTAASTLRLALVRKTRSATWSPATAMSSLMSATTFRRFRSSGCYLR
jgi:hypothetical protein